MTSAWRITTALACATLAGVVGVLWLAHDKRLTQRKLVETASLCRARAEQGDAKAEFNLGLMYSQGKGVPQDLTAAAHWYRQAADQGNPEAQYGLCDMYHRGKGVARDYTEAFAWCSKAADQDDMMAEAGVAFMYYQGEGVPQDYTESIRWYRKAADQGNVMAQDHLGYMYSQVKGISKAYGEAAYWYRKAAERGYPDAQYGLGYLYYEGKGVPRDRTVAEYWYRKAAKQGYPKAQQALGAMGEGSKAWKTARHIFLLVASMAGLWFSLEFLLPGRSIQGWRQKGTTLLGLTFLSYGALGLYGMAHDDMRYSGCATAFYLVKGILTGVAIVLFLVLGFTSPRNKSGAKAQ